MNMKLDQIIVSQLNKHKLQKAYRWILEIDGLCPFIITNVSLPSFNMTTEEDGYLGFMSNNISFDDLEVSIMCHEHNCEYKEIINWMHNIELRNSKLKFFDGNGNVTKEFLISGIFPKHISNDTLSLHSNEYFKVNVIFSVNDIKLNY